MLDWFKKSKPMKMSDNPYVGGEHRRIWKLIEERRDRGESKPTPKEGEHACPECHQNGIMRVVGRKGPAGQVGSTEYVQCDFCGWNDTLVQMDPKLFENLSTVTYVPGLAEMLANMPPTPGSHTPVRKDLMETPKDYDDPQL